MLAACVACTTARPPEGPPGGGLARERSIEPVPELAHRPLDPEHVRVQPEGDTVEQNWFLDLYTLLHSRSYRVFRVVLPSSGPGDAIAHLSLPAGEGPHPVIVMYPILGGRHVISELISKMLVRRGYAVARLERRELDLENGSATALADELRTAILDGRRLIDWLAHHPNIDSARVAAAGVSLGGIQALTLTAVEPRIRGGFYMLVGGGLAEIFYESAEKPIRAFRDRMIEEFQLADREAFLAEMRPYVRDLDPLTWVDRIETERILLVSGRFDRVVRPERTRILWEKLGRPTWRKIPTGHYQGIVFLSNSISLASKHLEQLFAV